MAEQRDRGETDKERVDRELLELLNELRVALPGVQVLFAFLLAVPFQQGFTRVDDFQRDVYYATLLLTTIATILLIAPTAYHRLNFRAERKIRIVRHANVLSICGLAVLSLAMIGVILLVTDFLFGTALTIVSTCMAAVLFALFWAVLPLRLRRTI